MAKQITEVPMKKKSKVKTGSKKRGKVNQMQCSPRNQMAMKGQD
jgi:hypothetical protein